jgi:hypothetical protein
MLNQFPKCRFKLFPPTLFPAGREIKAGIVGQLNSFVNKGLTTMLAFESKACYLAGMV